MDDNQLSIISPGGKARPFWFRILTGIGLVYALAACTGRPRSQGEPTQTALPYAAQLQQAIERVLKKHPEHPQLGISAAVVAPGYQLWSGVSGNSQPGQALTPEMLFDAGSIQKNFEAALPLELAQENRLSLDDPISQYLPPYPHVDGAITIRQLLNHTSGLFNVFEHPDFPWAVPGVDYARRWSLEEAIGAFVLEPYGPPGSTQHYASTNYLLLTAILEKVTHASMPDEIQRRFFEPLQLEHSTLSMGEAPPACFSLAHPWVDLNRDGSLEDLYGIPQTWKVSLTHPVLYATPSDLARWMYALYHQGSVLPPQSMAEMLTYPQTAQPDPEGGRYGLGVVDYSQILGVQAIGHAGAALGYTGAALYLPEYDLALAWLINTGESPPDLASQMMSSAWASLFAVIQKYQGDSPVMESSAD